MMDGTQGMGSGSEVGKLGDVISDAKRRRAFADDPEKTMMDAGIDVSSVPDDVRSTLSGLSYEELEVISRVRDSLDQAGVSREDQLKIF